MAVLDPPCALDHDTVGGVRAAEHERGERVAGAGEAELVERVEGKVGLLADGDRADVGAAEAARRAFARPAQTSRWVTEAAS